ncbi:hypothetical protein FQR65_LT12394 [Abscondita terminalis]|nr:hypothetical protein FQR65_LT12394 [Abscondita terminalis]
MNNNVCNQTMYGSIPPCKMENTNCVIYYVVAKSSIRFCRIFEGKMVSYDTDSDRTSSTRKRTKKLYDAHCRQYRSRKIDRKAWNKLVLASTLCFIFMVGEGLGGYLSQSLAIATDAAHLLADFTSYVVSLMALWLSTRSASKQMPWGWHNAEVMGALISILLIWVVTGELVFLAIMRLIRREFEIDAKIMLITSLCGVLVNFIIGFTLRGHGHSHDVQDVVGGENINVRAAFIHVIGDILQSIGVCIAAIVIYVRPEWNIIDPICTFVFSALVLMTTFNILKDSMVKLSQPVPKEIDYNLVMADFVNIDGIEMVYNLKIWTLNGDKIALAAYVIIGPNVKPHTILAAVSRKIRQKHSFFEMTLRIEQRTSSASPSMKSLIDKGRIAKNDVDDLKASAKSKLSDEQLALFLMSRDNDQARARSAMVKYFKIRKMLPEVFADRNINNERLQSQLRVIRFFCVSPRRTPDNCSVVFIKLKDTDYRKVCFESCMKIIGMGLDAISYFDPPEGIVTIFDFQGVRTPRQCT